MADYFRNLIRKKEVVNEDEEAYQDQLRAFNQAKEIIRLQQLEEERK